MGVIDDLKNLDLGQYVGQIGSEVVSAIKALVPDATVVSLAPGTMMTMDYREDRVKVHTDEAGVVQRVVIG